MKALIVIGVIVLVLFLLCMIRVGAEASYDDQGFRLAVRFWFFRLELGGKDKPPKKQKDKKKREDGAVEAEKETKKKLPPPARLRSIVRHGYAMLCRLVAHLRVDVLKLHFTAAFDDPAATALAYGAAGTMMESLQQIGGSRIVCSDMRADVDFDSGKPQYDLRISARLRIGRIIAEAARFGSGVLLDLMSDTRREHNNGKSSDR